MSFDSKLELVWEGRGARTAWSRDECHDKPVSGGVSRWDVEFGALCEK
jgi:hypothetical protein